VSLMQKVVPFCYQGMHFAAYEAPILEKREGTPHLHQVIARFYAMLDIVAIEKVAEEHMFEELMTTSSSAATWARPGEH
jgi:hypothetical protein